MVYELIAVFVPVVRCRCGDVPDRTKSNVFLFLLTWVSWKAALGQTRSFTYYVGPKSRGKGPKSHQTYGSMLASGSVAIYRFSYFGSWIIICCDAVNLLECSLERVFAFLCVCACCMPLPQNPPRPLSLNVKKTLSIHTSCCILLLCPPYSFSGEQAFFVFCWWTVSCIRSLLVLRTNLWSSFGGVYGRIHVFFYRISDNFFFLLVGCRFHLLRVLSDTDSMAHKRVIWRVKNVQKRKRRQEKKLRRVVVE